MSRSGYVDDYEHIALYRANVDRSLKSRKGQAFLRELAAAMDAMPVKELIAGELADGPDVCAIGSVCKARGIATEGVDVTDPTAVGELVGISRVMAAEIEYINDEDGPYGRSESAEERWQHMRKWVDKQLAAQQTRLAAMQKGSK